MIRNFLIIAAAALVLSVVCLAGAFALGGRELAANGWSWTIVDDDGDVVRFQRVDGEDLPDPGPQVTRTLNWDGGDALTVAFSGNVRYVQGDKAEVTLTGPQSVVERVRIENGRIDLADGDQDVYIRWGGGRVRGWDAVDQLQITVVAPSVTRFSLDGSGDLDIRDYDQPRIDIDLSGSGEIMAEGRTDSVDIDINGSGDVELDRLETRDAEVSISGSGDATVAPSGRAVVAISGSGDVTLTRRPQSVDSRISGSGQVHQP